MLARIAGWDGGITTSTSINNDLIDSKGVLIAIDSDVISINTSQKFLNGEARLYDSQGLLCKVEEINNEIIYFNPSPLSTGLYFIVVSNSNSRVVGKLVKF
jgi:hypothetical protein